MQLVERGLIGLDDDVREVVPAMKDLKVLLGFEGDDRSGEEFDGMAIARGGSGVDLEKMKSQGKAIFEDVKGKITLRYGKIG